MVTILTSLLILLCSNGLIAQNIYDDFQIKSGVVTSNQVWQGQIILASDVLIPEQVTLSLAPHTLIIFNNNDSHNLGEHPNKVELIAKGTLKQPLDKPATLISINDESIQNKMSKYEQKQSLNISADPVNAERLHSKISKHKRHYMISWTIIYSILLVFF